VFQSCNYWDAAVQQMLRDEDKPIPWNN
jgi:hypothetical protein